MLTILLIGVAILVVLGLALLSVEDAEGVVQGFGLIALLFATILGALALVEFSRRRRG